LLSGKDRHCRKRRFTLAGDALVRRDVHGDRLPQARSPAERKMGTVKPCKGGEKPRRSLSMLLPVTVTATRRLVAAASPVDHRDSDQLGVTPRL
jgi:hypothetical protein